MTFIFMKFRQWFNLLAFGTFFRYDCFSHNRFSIKRLLLEPFAAQSAFGSFYYNTSIGEVK